MAAGEYNIQIEQGATFKRTFRLKDATDTPINITGAKFKAQIRKKANDSEVVITLNSPDEIVITNAAQGEFRLFISHTVTSTFPDKEYEWDMFIEWPSDPVEVDRIIYGVVEFISNITEPSTN